MPPKEDGLWVAVVLLSLKTEEVGLQRVVLSHYWSFFAYLFSVSQPCLCALCRGTKHKSE